jgi:hypothetical protein
MMSGFHTYNKVHVAANGNSSEAEFHMDMDPLTTKGRFVKKRVIEIASVYDIEKMFSKLLSEHFEIDYLDFHAHGYAAAIYVDTYSKFTVDDLERFRNRGFDRIFRADAIKELVRNDHLLRTLCFVMYPKLSDELNEAQHSSLPS